MQWLAAVWDRVRRPIAFLRPIRCVVGPQLILLWAMNCSSQGKDTVRAVVEFSPKHTHPVILVWFCFAVLILALQSWYWSRQLLRVDFDHVPDEYTKPGTKLEKYAPRWIGGFAFFIAILSIALLFGDDTPKWWLLIAIGLLLLLAAIYATFVIKRRDWFTSMSKTPQRVTAATPFDRLTVRVLRSTALAAVALIVWTAWSPLTFANVFPSPPLLMISAALWVGIGSWLVYRADWYRVPIFGLLFVLAVLFSFVNDNHAVRKLAAIGSPRPAIGAQFNSWYAALTNKYPGNQPVIIVATEGGGVRAAYWTAAVLTELQDRAPSFADHVFAISSVSGGSIGAAMFRGLIDGGCGKPGCRAAAQDILRYDALAPALARFLGADLAQRFLPFGIPAADRQRALEAGWLAGWKKVRGNERINDGMLTMYGASRPLLPSLFLNGTVVERGNRTIASNCAIGPAEIDDAHDTFGTLGADMPLISAAGNSARFPYISPAGTLKGSDYDVAEHVVDGGYFDDSGTTTAAEIISAIRKANPNVSDISLIVIRFVDVPPRIVKPESFANEIASPPRALLAAWTSHSALAVVQTSRLGVTVKEFVLGQTKGGVQLPLGWLLAERSCVAIDMQVGTDVNDSVPPALRNIVTANVDAVKYFVTKLQPGQTATKSGVQTQALSEEAEMKK